MTGGMQNAPASNPFALSALAEPSAQLAARLQARQADRTVPVAERLLAGNGGQRHRRLSSALSPGNCGA